MKKTGLFISVMTVAIVLVSCSKEFVETPGEGQAEVGFSTLHTRGSSIMDSMDVANAGGFSVWAYKHTGPWTSAVDKTILIDNAGGYGHVTSTDGNTWDYGTPQYWPIIQKVSFFACAPHGYADWDDTLDASGVPVITCTVPTSISAHKDLMIANQVYNATGPDPVSENFHHALSRITFSALKANKMNDKVVKVKSISIEGVYDNGTASLEIPVSWTVNELSIQDYQLSVLGGSIRNIELSSTDVQNLLPHNEFLFLMPQVFPSSAKLVIEFTTDDKDLRWSGEIPAPSTWLAGRSYHYKLLIDGDLIVVICGQLENPVSGSEWGNY